MKWKKELKDAIEIANRAGNFLKKNFQKGIDIKRKSGIHNLVTSCDLQSEEMIVDFLKKRYPSYSILSEEMGKKEKKSPFEWIIDPLDGTVNFAHGIPHFSVTIALKKEEIVLGTTYQPMTEELFFATEGGGAFLGKKRLSVSNKKNFKDSILATGFPYNLKDNPNRCIERFVDIIKMGIPIRRLGSAAIDLAYVADGRFDGYWETNLGDWDVAAGSLFIKEAGGKATNWQGIPFKISGRNSIIATNGLIHPKFLKIFKGL